jgi:hypothetical protein
LRSSTYLPFRGPVRPIGDFCIVVQSDATIGWQKLTTPDGSGEDDGQAVTVVERKR